MTNITNFGKLVDELKGQEISLLVMDNTLKPNSNGESIFEYDEYYWNSWKHEDGAVYSYNIKEDVDINIYFEIVEDYGINKDTIIKIVKWEEI